MSYSLPPGHHHHNKGNAVTTTTYNAVLSLCAWTICDDGRVKMYIYVECSIQRSLRARLHAFVCDKSHPLCLLDKQLRMTCTIMANDDDDAIRIYKTFRIAAASPSIVRVSVYGECLYRVWELAFQYADSRRRSVSSRARFGWSWCWMGVRDEWSPLFAEFAWFSYLRTVASSYISSDK